jgi:hypothetical protein
MHYMTMLRHNYACEPAMTWLQANAHLSPKEQWDTCPDGSWMAWPLGLYNVRKSLRPEAVQALREWAMRCAHRAITEHAPKALLAAAACNPDEVHRNALLKHAETLAGLQVTDADAAAAAARSAADAAAAAARYAADAAAAAAARYAAAAAARYAAAAAARYAAAADDDADDDDARSTERQQQANDLRTVFRWEWVEEALAKAGVELRTPAENVSTP